MGRNFTADQSAPAVNWAAVTPHNSNNLPAGCRALYVGGAGDIAVVGYDDVAVTFTGVVAGTILPLAAKRVNATNTTATLIVALF
jgi:hypothetical protein